MQLSKHCFESFGGATTFRVMAFSITTLSIMTFSTTTLRIMTFSTTTLSIMTFSIVIRKCDIQYYDTYHTLMLMLRIIMLSILYAERHN